MGANHCTGKAFYNKHLCWYVCCNFSTNLKWHKNDYLTFFCNLVPPSPLSHNQTGCGDFKRARKVFVSYDQEVNWTLQCPNLSGLKLFFKFQNFVRQYFWYLKLGRKHVQRCFALSYISFDSLQSRLHLGTVEIKVMFCTQFPPGAFLWCIRLAF